MHDLVKMFAAGNDEITFTASASHGETTASDFSAFFELASNPHGRIPKMVVNGLFVSQRGSPGKRVLARLTFVG